MEVACERVMVDQIIALRDQRAHIVRITKWHIHDRVNIAKNTQYRVEEEKAVFCHGARSALLRWATVCQEMCSPRPPIVSLPTEASHCDALKKGSHPAYWSIQEAHWFISRLYARATYPAQALASI